MDKGSETADVFEAKDYSTTSSALCVRTPQWS